MWDEGLLNPKAVFPEPRHWHKAESRGHGSTSGGEKHSLCSEEWVLQWKQRQKVCIPHPCHSGGSEYAVVPALQPAPSS